MLRFFCLFFLSKEHVDLFNNAGAKVVTDWDALSDTSESLILTSSLTDEEKSRGKFMEV